MRTWVIECWDGVMNQWYNPLKYIPDLQVRHMVLQILAWLWCIAFSLYFASWFLFGVTVVAHFVLIAAIVVTVASFKLACHIKCHYQKMIQVVNMIRPQPDTIIIEQEDDGDYEND